MKVNLPLKLTYPGSQWRKSKTVTVYFSNGTQIKTNVIDQSMIIPGMQFTFEQSSGYDATGVRMTNLVGFNGSYFTKCCPLCKKAKPTYAFGCSGRYDSSRDQSQCIDCRKPK